MSPKQLPVKMESKKDSSSPSWNVVGSNDGSTVPLCSTAADIPAPEDRRNVDANLSPFMRTAKELHDIYDDEEDDPIVNSESMKDLKMPSLCVKPKDDSPTPAIKKVNEIIATIDPMTNIIVKVFYAQKKTIWIPPYHWLSPR